MNIVLNGQSHEVAPAATVAELLAVFEVPQRGIAVEVNGELVPRKAHSTHRLCADDRLEIVTLVGGG